MVQNVRKKPIMVNLVAALIMCLVTFIIGFSISSFVLLDSRIESAQEKNSELSLKIDEKDSEIKDLNATLEQKSKENVLLGEKIQEQAVTIENLKSDIASLQDNVAHISEVALGGASGTAGTLVTSVSALSVTEQLVILIAMLVLLVLIISISCVFISSFNRKKADDASMLESNGSEIKNPDEASLPKETEEPHLPEEDAPEQKEEETPALPHIVTDAINLLYRNGLEEAIPDLGGFRFGVTNFDEILSDKAKGKSFGNTDNGDFVAFLASDGQRKKLYIIPRYLTLSDSTVALRGVTDLFNITDGVNAITSGAVRIKSIAQPAVFSCGEHGWSIESKGNLIVI